MVNGHRTQYVRNSQHEARCAAKLLTAASNRSGTGLGAVKVVAVIAVMGARRGLTIKRQPDGVVVTTRKDIRGWLEIQPEQLTDTQVDALHGLARRSTTWQ